MNNNQIINSLEAILFVNGDGISKQEILSNMNINKTQLEDAIKKLKSEYSEDRGIHLIEYGDNVQFVSNAEYAKIISDVLNPIKEKKLTRAMLEALAIIAYKQPVTRLDIENIRGVSSDYAIQNLLKHEMIEVVGRKDSLGRPMLFGTTDLFLRRFDLKNIDDLPSYDELLEKLDVITNINEKNLYDTNRDDESGDTKNEDSKDNEDILDEEDTKNTKQKSENNENK